MTRSLATPGVTSQRNAKHRLVRDWLEADLELSAASNKFVLGQYVMAVRYSLVQLRMPYVMIHNPLDYVSYTTVEDRVMRANFVAHVGCPQQHGVCAPR